MKEDPPSALRLQRAMDAVWRPNPRRKKSDGYMEWFDSVCGRLLYGSVQSGDDLAQYGGGSERGLHVTDRRHRELIERIGLGVHPSLSLGSFGGIEEHETLHWACIYLKPSDAMEVNRLIDARRTQDAVRVAEAGLLRSYPDLKVVWFYPCDGGCLGTSKNRGEECSFDLSDVGAWVASNGEEAYSFDDSAGGQALAWVGPPIPPDMLRWA